MLSAQVDGISIKRKAAAGAAMLGTAGVMAWESFRHWRVEWIPLAFAAMLCAGAVGITRKALPVQMLSRGAAWILLFPATIVVLVQLLNGRMPGFTETALAATTSAALWLSSPMLRAKQALADFAPKAYRRILLAGSTATAATAYLTGGVALELLGQHGWSRVEGLPFAALTLCLLAAAVAVVRMRAWGVLLGAATSIVLLLSSIFVGNGWGALLAMCAAPMLALHVLPIVLARYGFGRGKTPPPTRVASSFELEFEEPARYRVAQSDELDLEESEPAFTPARAAALRSP